MSAQMIENHMFADIFPKAIRMHFHTRSEFLGTLVEGIAVFSPDGRFISANRSAQFQIGLPFAALKAHTFSSLFGIPISSLFELFSGTMPTPKQLVLHNGVHGLVPRQAQERSALVGRQAHGHPQRRGRRRRPPQQAAAPARQAGAAKTASSRPCSTWTPATRRSRR